MSNERMGIYRVKHPIVAPVVANVGQLLVIWPGHPTRTVSVCGDLPGYPVLRTAACRTERLNRLMLAWYCADTLECQNADDERLLLGVNRTTVPTASAGEWGGLSA